MMGLQWVGLGNCFEKSKPRINITLELVWENVANQGVEKDKKRKKDCGLFLNQKYRQSIRHTFLVDVEINVQNL